MVIRVFYVKWTHNYYIMVNDKVGCTLDLCVCVCVLVYFMARYKQCEIKHEQSTATDLLILQNTLHLHSIEY